MYSYSRLMPAIIFATVLLVPGTIFAQSLQHRPEKPAAPPPKSETPRALPAKPTLPAGTCLQVEIPRNYPMKAGESIEGHLVYPLYVDGNLVVPANTPVK